MRSVVFPSRHGSGYSFGTSSATLRAESKPFNGGSYGGHNGGGNGNGNGGNGNGNHGQTVNAAATPTLADLAFSPAAGAEFRHVQPNEVAWDAVRDAGKIVFVREGLLRVYQGLSQGRQRLVQLVGAGHWAGAEAFAGNVNGSAAKTRIVAAETSHVALVDANKFIQLAMADANLGRELVRQLARFATGLNVQLTEATLLDCERQLLHALLRLSRNGGGNRDGGRVTLRLTQQDLADSLGIARETANGMLQRLAEQQLIQKRRGRISFDVAQLEQFAATADATPTPVAVE